ncbi:MAG: hypothetical protein M5R36_24195 [Deltaproteobacteria bacterium]|nr:hypothetical protein [Deltaproteobacteria bacterium]
MTKLRERRAPFAPIANPAASWFDERIMTPGRKRIVFVAALAVFCAALELLTNHQFLFDRYAYHDDVAEQIYFRVQARDPGAFPNDLLAEYSANAQPFGTRAIYGLLAYVFDPITAGEWLWLLHLPLAAYFLFRLGETSGDAFTGCSLATLSIVALWGPLSDGVGSGGDFLLAILAALAWSLNEGRFGVYAATLVVANLFHPVPVAVGLVALGPALFQRHEKWFGLAGRGRRNLAMLGVAALVCVGWNLRSYVFANDAGFGPMVTRKEFLAMPEFGPGDACR